MRRGVFDTLRRALDATLANWPLILIRLGETIVFGAIAVIGAIAVLVPILLSIGISFSKVMSPDDFVSAILALAGKWMLLVWILIAVSVLLLLFIAVHAFVEAGCVRVYVDAERLTGPAVEGPRSRFAIFSMDRWFSGGADGWWTLFWIYNLAWGLAGLILLIPLLPTAVLMLLFREQPPALIATGCLGLGITVLLLIVVTVGTGMWTTRAIAEWALRRIPARDALSIAWQEIRVDLARHLLIAVAIFVVAMAGAAFFSSFSFFAAFGEAMHKTAFNVVTLPLRLVGSILSSAFSAAVTSWYLASYSALAVETSRAELSR